MLFTFQRCLAFLIVAN